MSKRLRPHLRTTGSVKLLYLLKLVSFSVLLCLSSVWSQAQERMVTGVVRDGKGSPLPGVTVRVKNEKRAVMTDPNGNFRIPVSPGSSALVFSFVGFENQELPISNEKMSVTLRESSKSLNEVVVVGYGTQRRAATTGAIASVKAAEITQSPITNVAQGIQARVAGLQVTQNNAAPGGNISVRVRGTNSINGSSEPLYIIDGIQISNEGSANSISPLSTINPNDIESAEILKDASATAIYGARAANGVVLITTKRGKNGPTRVGLETYGGVQEVTKTLDLLNATQFAELENEIYKNAIYTDPASLGKGTDWQGEIFRKAGMQNHQLSINGGTEKTQFSLSANYFDQDGVVIRSDFKRYSLRLSLDHKINDRFRIGTTILGSNSISNTVPTAVSSMDGPIATTSIIGAALAAPPSLVPYREDGSVLPTADQFNGRYREVANPVGLAQILNRTNLKRTLTNLYGEVNILKRLTYRASFNVDFSNSLNDYYSPLSIIAQVERNANSGAAQKNNRYTTDLLHESILTYNGAFGDHSLKVTGVFGTQSNTFSGNYINASGFPNDVTGNESVGIATNRTVSSEKTRARLDSYMGRINYGYRNRYFLDLTARVDGASKFGENNKYGFFPAAAVAWRLIEEQFMKDQKLFSDFKLRASYGVTGNAAAISPYQSLALLNQGNDYVFNHVYTIGISPVGIANRDLQWEKSKQLNVGLDVSILNDRISLIADAYNKKTDGLLFVKNLPLSSGYASFPGNFASIENKGVELAVNARIIDSKLKWNVSGNISFNRNKLVSLEGGMTEFVLSPYSVLQVGKPVGIFKTYVFEGIYQTGETVLPGSGSRVGGTKVADLNKDGEITAADQTITGDSNPDYIFGLSTSLRYKRFDLAAFISGVQGNQLYNLSRYSFENPLGGRNLLAGAVNRWSPTNPNNDYTNGAQGGRIPVSDRFVEDGSFIRLKNISLGYTLPRIKGVSNARIYVSANNLLTITDYSGYDPEVNTFGGSNVLVGVDNLVYPTAKTFLLGLQIGF